MVNISIIVTLLKTISYLFVNLMAFLGVKYIPFEHDYGMSDVTILSFVYIATNITVSVVNLLFFYLTIRIGDRINQYNAILFNMIFGMSFSVVFCYVQYILNAEGGSNLILFILIVLSMTVGSVFHVVVQEIINFRTINNKVIVASPEDFDVKN